MLDKLFSFQKSRLSGVTTLFKHIKSCCIEERSKVYSMCINTTRSNGLELHQRKFTLDIKKTFLTVRKMHHWSRFFSREVEEPLVLKGCRETVGISRVLHPSLGPSLIVSLLSLWTPVGKLLLVLRSHSRFQPRFGKVSNIC